ncbi:DUF4860 domain-containing protein [Oscillospiraceae bacterium MB08-C2-2]|nr:DUF4860 domain-containing protein [Oscillospiraceae bacterium MB08-C2-2]
MKVAPGKPSGHMIDILFTLALFCVFAASSLMVVLMGANIYRGTTQKMNSNFDTRTSITYVATKIRQNDQAGAVFVDQVGDTPALVLEQQVGDSRYQTWIYHWNGMLMEVFTAQGNAFEPASGQQILEVPVFEIQKEGSLLKFTSVDAQGLPVSLLIAPRTGAEEGANL